MSRTVIKVENLSKLYRLGEVGTGTLSHDLNRWWARVRGKEDPFAKVGQVNDRTQKAVKGEHVWALKDIDFEVKQGEVLGIIGKNGAGKSTLLKLLSRITSPTTGNIKAKGRIASLLEVGTGMHPEMTGRENVYLNGTIMGMTRKEIDRKFDEIVDFAGCAKYADTPVKRYSSGMKVRLGFAVAAFLEPEILIVDEVLAVGDAEFQKKAIGKMQDISSGGGRTVLFVSHNMASIENLCSRCVVLKNGEIDGVGETPDMIQHYLSDNASENNTDLSMREDRNGEGNLTFTKILFLNGDNQHINIALTGMKLKIRLYYNVKENQNLPYSRVSLAFKKSNQTYIMLSTELIEEENLSIKGDGYVEFIVEKFPLTAGAYELTIFAESNKVVQDWVVAATKLMVESGDYYGTGHRIPEGYDGKSVLVDFSFNNNSKT